MPESESKTLKQTLAQEDLHEQWSKDYGLDEGAAFFERVFDRLTDILAAPRGTLILDAGCGSATGSILFARRGFRVQAVDFSESVLKSARTNVREAGFGDQIQIQQEDLLSLSFPDGSFDHILCWGVLMHIAEVEQALSELTRVLKPGGSLIISEINQSSLQRKAFIGLTRILGKSRAGETKTPAGMECWFSTPAGTFLRRHTNIGWLVQTLKGKGLTLRKRLPGQFTELHLKLASRRFKGCVYSFNAFWFRFVRDPHLAFGNILIFEKNAHRSTRLVD
jgi:2-polyprenyl-3-methyl-5-hydroxy-6-metoxy-1,4-benzoquinol methylase